MSTPAHGQFPDDLTVPDPLILCDDPRMNAVSRPVYALLLAEGKRQGLTRGEMVDVLTFLLCAMLARRHVATHPRPSNLAFILEALEARMAHIVHDNVAKLVGLSEIDDHQWW